MAFAGKPKADQPDAAADVQFSAPKETPQQRREREYAERHEARAQALAAWGLAPPIGRPYQTDRRGVVTGVALSDNKLRFLMIGLDAAGKTTITYRLVEGAEVLTTIPTIGFNVETVDLPTAKSAGVASDVTVWDVGGRDKIRPLWRHYWVYAHALVFVVDSNDRERMDDSQDYEHSAMEELMRLMDEDELKGKPVLVIANKQDLPNAMTPAQVTKALCFPPEALWEGKAKSGSAPRAAVEMDVQPLVRYLLLGKTAFDAKLALEPESTHNRPLTARAKVVANSGVPGSADGWLPVDALARVILSYVSFSSPYLRVVGCSATTDITPVREGFEWLCEAVYARANMQPPARAPRGLLSNCTLM